MSKNINISSGSKSFQNKIFGSIVKLSKPSFAYEGKIFSDSIFDNQRTIPVLEDNIYYANHGLPDEPIIYLYEYAIDLNLYIQSIINNSMYSSLAGPTTNAVSTRNANVVLNTTIPSPLSLDPSDPSYQCQLLNGGPP